MLLKLLIAGLLVVVTVIVHAVGFALLLRTIMRSRALDRSGFRPVTTMVIGLVGRLILIHLAEIAVWGMFYSWATAISCCPSIGGCSHRLKR